LVVDQGPKEMVGKEKHGGVEEEEEEEEEEEKEEEEESLPQLGRLSFFFDLHPCFFRARMWFFTQKSCCLRTARLLVTNADVPELKTTCEI
jgi:hypothetical protein